MINGFHTMRIYEIPLVKVWLSTVAVVSEETTWSAVVCPA